MMKFIQIRFNRNAVGLLRFIAIMIAICSLPNIATVSAQNKLIPVKFTNATVQEVFTYLDNKTEYDFVYNNQQIATLPRVSIDKSATVIDIIKFCLRNSNLSYQIKGNIIVIRPKNEILGNNKEAIKFGGRVMDDHGQPVAGVSILGMGTNTGSVTNANGEFIIILPKNDNLDLRFSFIGLKTREMAVIRDGKVLVRNPLDVQVKMETDVNQIEDVVVTGVVNISKKSFTGSSTTIGREEMKKVSPTNILSAVQIFDPTFRMVENISAGSNPNAIPEMYVRGRSGFGTPEEINPDALSEFSLKNNPNLPIFILDGFEVSVTRIFDLDIDRIETYTILKDAAATAMYGSRAANGVVVITTTPPAGSGLSVSYNFNLTLNTPDLSSYNMMNATDKIEAERKAGLFSSTDPSSQAQLWREYNLKLQQLEKGVNTDWMNIPLRNAVGHKHSVSLNGGSDAFKFAFDLRYDNNSGAMKGNKREKMGAGMTLQYNYKTLMFRNAMNADITKGTESPYGSFSEFSTMNPYDIYWDQFGNPLKELERWGSGAARRNPMYDATLGNYDDSKYREFYDNFGIKWYATKKINFEANVALSYNVENRDRFMDPDSGSFLGRPNKKGSYDKALNTVFGYDMSVKGYYNDKIGKHNLNLVMGFNAKEDKSVSSLDRFVGFPSGGYSSPNYAEMLDTYSRTTDVSRLMGVLGVFNYTYDNIYLFDLSGRIDGSSQFGANKKYAPFYSVGAGINIHNYKAVSKAMPWLTTFKIRGTYGMTGKVNFPPYAAQNKYEVIKDYQYATGTGVAIKYLGNPNLKWEKTIISDVGFEMDLFQGIFNLKYTYYNKDTKDLLSDFHIPSSSGFLSYKENVGTIQNRGHEVYINTRVFSSKDWTVNLSFNGTRNRNKIVEISNALKSYNDKVNDFYNSGTGLPADQARPRLIYVEGGSMESIFGMESLGIDPGTGKEMFRYKDGSTGYSWLGSENVVIGNKEPDLSGSFGCSVRWKGITLDAYFLYEWGADRYNTTLMDKIENVDVRQYNCDYRVLNNRWSQPGDISQFKSIKEWQKTTRPTSRFVQDYNNLNMSSFSLGYEFNRKAIERYGMYRLKLQFNMRDVFTASSVRVERGTGSPYAKAYTFSLSASF